jgi:nucleoside-diphosphate-sugar epimerase
MFGLIHRDDVAGCVIAALKSWRADEIYNAVDDEPVSWIDFSFMCEQFRFDLAEFSA